DRARITVGDTVVILGAGTVGLLMQQLAKIAGAARTIVIEPNEVKRGISQKLGADVVLNPGVVPVLEAISDVTHVGADVVIECAGGSEADVVVVLAEVGTGSACVGAVGGESYGKFLQRERRGADVDVHELKFGGSRETRLAFVAVDRSGERVLEFHGRLPAGV